MGGETGEAIARGTPKAALVAGGALGAEDVYQRSVKHGPGGYAFGVLKSRMPGTQEYYMRQMALSRNPGLF